MPSGQQNPIDAAAHDGHDNTAEGCKQSTLLDQRNFNSPTLQGTFQRRAWNSIATTTTGTITLCAKNVGNLRLGLLWDLNLSMDLGF